MTVSAPPRPPSQAPEARDSKPLDREEIKALVEALIEEARREQRRRHRKYWALAALAALVGAVILILLDGGAASQTASPAPSGRSGAAGGRPSSKIAFASTVGCIPLRHCWWGLYVMNLDGSGKRRLARHFWVSNFGESPLAWSPDRRKLLFSAHLSRSAAPCASYCGKEIFVINADGSGLRRLTRNNVADWEPDWSPDGQKIAWSSRGPNGTGADVFVMNADGSNQQNLTPKPGNRGEPRWSPDGQAILFTAVQPVQPPSGAAPYRDVYVMNADGSRQRNLTHTPESGEGDPAWSPDGQHIAFTRLAWSRPVEVGIVVMNADGSAKHAVTPTIAHTGDGWITETAWSPDGRRIAFDDHDATYIVNADGSGLRRLAQNATFHSWSPDGRKLIFSRLRNPHEGPPATAAAAAAARQAGADLWVMNADGSGQRIITHVGPPGRARQRR
jgi:Tol biopolymer transport system component